MNAAVPRLCLGNGHGEPWAPGNGYRPRSLAPSTKRSSGPPEQTPPRRVPHTHTGRSGANAASTFAGRARAPMLRSTSAVAARNAVALPG